MAALKAGKYEDIAGSMAELIEAAMQDEWSRYHGESLPGEGREDRLIMFKAVARGVLGYLEAHQADILTTDVSNSGSHHHTLKFEVSDT
ncbi:MAG TPA: hypothetical protein VF104_11730 [Burkholderiales bacterium]